MNVIGESALVLEGNMYMYIGCVKGFMYMCRLAGLSEGAGDCRYRQLL